MEQPAGNPLINGVSAVDFGAVAVGQSAIRGFTIRNIGTADLLGLSAETNQPDDNYSISMSPISSVVPGATTTFAVTFAPNSSGSKINGILVRSNVAGAAGRFQALVSGVASGPTATPTPTYPPPTGTPTLTPTPSIYSPVPTVTPTPTPTNTPIPTPTPTPTLPPNFGLVIQLNGGGDALVSFATYPGRTYEVQSNDDLLLGWQTVLTFTASPGQYSASIVDPTANTHPELFYRVVDVAQPTLTPPPTGTPSITPTSPWTPTPTQTPTPTPTLTATPTSTGTPAQTPSPTPTPPPALTPSATQRPTPTLVS